jgi:hypothetical protein
MPPLIAILPYELRRERNLQSIPLDALYFPLGARPTADMKTVADLRQADHLIVFCCSVTLYRSYRQFRCKVSLLIAEPRAVQLRYHLLALIFGRKFFKVLTFSGWLLKLLPNSVFHVGPGKTVGCLETSTKKSLLSIIASNKRKLSGHKLRHEFIERCRLKKIPLDLFGRAYKVVDRKEEALTDYMYSVVIENSREANYYTEKLIDCFLQRVIPIYWGAPNIGDFFNPEGLVICNSVEDLIRECEKLTPQTYQQRENAIEENFQLASAYPDIATAAAKKLESVVQLA